MAARRGGLSRDPEKAERQRQVLAEGRRIARERREQGLPTKRTEEARKSGTGRVAPGRYRQPAPPPKPASSGSKPKPKPAAARKPASSPETPPKEPGRLVKAYARILGYA